MSWHAIKDSLTHHPSGDGSGGAHLYINITVVHNLPEAICVSMSTWLVNEITLSYFEKHEAVCCCLLDM